MPRAAVDPRAVLPGTGFAVRDAEAAARLMIRHNDSLRRVAPWRAVDGFRARGRKDLKDFASI